MIRDDKEVPSNRLNERTYVELPFLRQLQAQGWSVIDLPMHDQEPEDTGRTDAAEVVLLPRDHPHVEELHLRELPGVVDLPHLQPQREEHVHLPGGRPSGP